MIYIIFLLLSSDKIAIATYTETPPIIDGKLEEAVWDSAFVINELIQSMPKRNAIPTESTKVYILYDENNLYIGAKCFDDPTKIRADCRIRDNNKIGWDDGISIAVSPSYDKNSGYCFMINAIGTQYDGRVFENANPFDNAWDGIWTSKASTINSGWEVEVAIPFSILKYDKKIKTWGFEFTRGIIRKNEVDDWVLADKITDWGILKIDTDKITHKSGRIQDLSLIPYFLCGEELMKDTTRVNIGVGISNIRYNLSEKSAVEVTVNPDYSNVEADIDEFTLDKLPLYLPEKRPFFIEEKNLFNTPVEVMYTRSIGSIAYGGKFTGRFHNIDIGILGTVMNDTIPEDTISQEKVLCMRVKKIFDFGTLGLLGIDNQNPSNQVLNCDGFITLPWNLHCSFQVAENWRDNQRSNLLYHFNFNRLVATGLTFGLTHEYIPSNFDDVRGFFNMKNLINSRGYIEIIQLINKWGMQVFTGSVGYTHWDTENKEPIARGKSGGIRINFVRNIRIGIGISDKQRWWRGKSYHNRLYSFSNSYSPGGNEGFGVFYTYGNYFGGTLYYPGISINHTFLKKLSTTLYLSSQIFKQNNETSRDFIATFISSVDLLSKLNFRTFLQWSDLSKEFGANFLLTYEFFAGSHIYLVWNETRDVNEFELKEKLPPLIDRKAVFKACYEFKF